MATHDAVMTVAARVPLEIHQVPTETPKDNEVRIKVQFATSTPLDLHIADGGLLTQHPKIMGSGYAGVIVEKHPSVSSLELGDKVFGFGLQATTSNGHQIYVTVPTHFVSKLPEGSTLQEAVTTTGSLVTVFRAMTADLDLELPWPVPKGYVHPHANDVILVWGGSGSVGMFALQVLRYWGFKRIFATGSKKNHALLRDFGATQVFDYRDPDVLEQLRAAAGPEGIKYTIDCIGHLDGTVRPLAKILGKGDKVAIVLPVIKKDATLTEAPEYLMDATEETDWAEGVVVKGIRCHFYDQDPVLKEKAQPEIVPALLASGAVKPTGQKIVEGKTLLERAQKALDILRSKENSAERLVWRVAEE